MLQEQKTISWEQIGKHISPGNCWVVIEGNVYNVTDFLVEHPGGDEILLKWSGLNASSLFMEVNHSQYAVSLRNARIVGKVEQPTYPIGYEEKIKQMKAEQKKKSKPIKKISQPINMQLVKSHKSQQNCWVVINGFVYDVTNYLETHPGGVGKLMQYAGKDATLAFQQAGHTEKALKTRQEFKIGEIQKKNNHFLIAFVALVLVALVIVVCAFY